MPFGYSLRGHCRTERRKEWVPRFVATRPIVLPLLWGEGWGEGERGRRTVAAAQYVFGTRETERQFLAASGANDRHAREPHEIPQAAGFILAGYALGHGHE